MSSSSNCSSSLSLFLFLPALSFYSVDITHFFSLYHHAPKLLKVLHMCLSLSLASYVHVYVHNGSNYDDKRRTSLRLATLSLSVGIALDPSDILFNLMVFRFPKNISQVLTPTTYMRYHIH